MSVNYISKNKVKDFISFAKTGKTKKLQSAINLGMDVAVEDSKAFILSTRYGHLENLKILLINLNSVEKNNIIRHCFLEGCKNNQREIVDYLLEYYFDNINEKGMENFAIKSCIIGGNIDFLCYLCAKYEFNHFLSEEILDWALKNDYKEAYSKLEIVFLNKKITNNKMLTNSKKKTIKI